MRTVRHLGALAAATVLAGASLAVPSARADDFGVALNGTYAMKSDGEQAKTNEVFFDQQTVMETWKISTTCASPVECTGQVVSDRGYTATAKLDDYWYIRHDVPNWLPCPDGSFATGHQQFILLGWNPAAGERDQKNTDMLIGRNVTKSDSGACGVNQPKVIELPIVIQRL